MNIQNTIINKNNEKIQEIDKKIQQIDDLKNKSITELNNLKKIIIQPFEIIINDITNYPDGFVNPYKNTFKINNIMSESDKIIQEPIILDIDKTKSVMIANDSKSNTIIAISPNENSSFPILFNINIKIGRAHV